VDGVALAGLREALGEAPPGGDVEVVGGAVLFDGHAGLQVGVAVLGGLELRVVREAPDDAYEVLAALEDLAAAFGGDGGLVAGEEADAFADDAREALVLPFAGGVAELFEAAVREGGLALLEGTVEAGGVGADDAHVVVVGACDALAVFGGVLDLSVEADVEDGGVSGAVLELELVDGAGEGDAGFVVHLVPPGAGFLWG